MEVIVAMVFSNPFDRKKVRQTPAIMAITAIAMAKYLNLIPLTDIKETSLLFA